MPHAKKLPRFNVFSVGRAGVLFKRGWNRQRIVDYYLKKYGSAWGVKTSAEMEDFLFAKRAGIRPNFSRLFEGKTEDEIGQTFKEWAEKAKARAESARQRLRQLHKDPEFAKAHAKRMRRLWAAPKWRELQRQLISVGCKRHFARIKQR